jgi:hypothetical protein
MGHRQRRLWSEDLSTANFLMDSHEVQKEISGNLSTCLFPELNLEELVFICHKFYSIFLLAAMFRSSPDHGCSTENDPDFTQFKYTRTKRTPRFSHEEISINL